MNILIMMPNTMVIPRKIHFSSAGDDEMTNKIKALTKEIYGILGMRGIVRMDYIINKDEIPFLIEINSVPGMSKESIVPQMAKTNNIELSLLF